jgi:hypothetical protein
MAVPKPPNFDAVGWRDRLKEAIPKRPDGTAITVWNQIVEWTKWQRLIRDNVESQRIQLVDHKRDLDAHTERLNKHADRLAVLEARPTSSPFPG